MVVVPRGNWGARTHSKLTLRYEEYPIKLKEKCRTLRVLGCGKVLGKMDHVPCTSFKFVFLGCF